MDQNKNLLLATALSFIVILVWFVLFPPPEPVADPNAQAPAASQTEALVPPGTAADPSGGQAPVPDVAPQAARLDIDTERLAGSVSLSGGRLDDLSLKNYRETLDEDADI